MCLWLISVIWYFIYKCIYLNNFKNTCVVNWRREQFYLFFLCLLFFAASTMERSLEPLNIAELESITNWHERFALYAMTNDRINNDNRFGFYLTLIGREAYNPLKDLSYP